MTLVKLQTGELVNEKEIMVRQVHGELSRFMHILIEDSRFEEGKFYVSTNGNIDNENFYNTILITDDYRKAYDVALNISFITGMKVISTSRFAGTEHTPLAVSEIKMFAKKINSAVKFDFDNEMQSARVYGARKKDEMGVIKNVLEGRFSDCNFDAYGFEWHGDYEVYEIIKYFDLYSDSEDLEKLKRDILVLEELHSTYESICDSYEQAVDITINLDNLEYKNKFESMLKHHGFETHISELERSVIVYEALQGIVNERGYDKQDEYEHADEGRFNAQYTTFVREVDEERDCILLEHKFEIADNYSENVSMLETILSDIDNSEFKLYIDDEKAHDKYEYYLENPTISSSQIDELKEIAEKIYQLQHEISEIDDASFNSHAKHLGEFVKTLERLYDDIEEFTDKL